VGLGRGKWGRVPKAFDDGHRRLASIRLIGKQMKLLITGGAGFIGSHLAHYLVQQGHAIYVIDNECTGRRENLPGQARFFKGDVAIAGDLEPVFSMGLDAVCHIAGQVSMIRSFADPVTDLRTNVEGTINTLQLCLKYRVPRLLYASSMTVYGHTDALPIPEEHPCAPASYYGITKYAAERYVHATGGRLDLDSDIRVTSFRMYNVYGPRQALDNPYQGVLGIFLGNVLRGEPITIFGDGEQSRDFVYVEDVARAWAAALHQESSYGSVFNLGSGRRLTINQVADQVLAAFQRSRADWPVHYLSARPGEQRHVEADIKRLRCLLKWEPQVSFEAGLEETLRWATSENVGAHPSRLASQSAG
jgi:UDP-glucose 4-epimerase